MAREWFYVRDGAQSGPVSEDEVLHLIRNGNIDGDTLVWAEGMDDWEPARLHFETRRRYAMPGVPRSGGTSPQPPARSDPRTGQRGPDGLYSGAPSRGFTEATRVCLRRYFGFSGRASRSEFWYFVLFGILTGFAAGIVDVVALGHRGEDQGIVASIATLLLFFPSLAATFRRLHDTGRSGVWALLLYIAPILFTLGAVFLVAGFAGQGAATIFVAFGIAWLVLLLAVLVFLCTRGDPGPNAYG